MKLELFSTKNLLTKGHSKGVSEETHSTISTVFRRTGKMISCVILLLILTGTATWAQMSVTPALNQAQVESVVNALAGSGVKINSVTYQSYASGSESSVGGFNFSGSSPVSGISSGLLISTGKISSVPGANYYNNPGTALSLPGNAYITSLVQTPTYDATEIIIHFVPFGDSLHLKYSFGSDEYPEKVCGVNDRFAFLLSGPGIVGEYNMGRLPGTYSNYPASINTINGGSLGTAPGTSAGYCPVNYSSAFINNPTSTSGVISWDGYTQSLIARAKIYAPCQEYTLRIVIADAVDGLMDSGLLIAQGSIESKGQVTIRQAYDAPVGGVCQGTATNLHATKGYQVYKWYRNGALLTTVPNDSVISVSLPGNYEVEVNNLGCTAKYKSPVFTPNIIALPDTGITSPDLSLCRQTSGVTLTAKEGGAGWNYSWLPDGQTTRSITATTPGIYTLTISKNGCSYTSTKEVRGNTMQINGEITHLRCFKVNEGRVHLTITNKVSQYTYSWTGPQVPPSNQTYKSALEDLCCLYAGTYTVTVSDTDACVKTASFIVTQPDSLYVIASVPQEKTGTATADVFGGTQPYTYKWYKLNTTATLGTEPIIENLKTAGDYVIQVNDQNLCGPVKDTVTIQAACNLSVTFTNSDASCISAEDGQIQLTVTGTEQSLDYTWKHNGEEITFDGQDYLTALPGTYLVKVRDFSGCEWLSPPIVVSSPAFTANVSTVAVKCNGGSNGSAQATVTSGTGYYAYVWKNSTGTVIQSSGTSISGLAAGEYTVEITKTELEEENNCTLVKKFTITEPASLSSTSVIQHPDCAGQQTGTIVLTPQGGVAPYAVSWTGPDGFVSSALSLTALKAGSYPFTLTDGNNCVQVGTKTITVPDPITLTFSEQGQPLGKVDLTAQGGTPGVTTPYTYLWGNGFAGEDPEHLNDGQLISVEVTDSKGCHVSDSYTVTEGCDVTITSIVPTDVACFGSSNGSITVNATSPTGLTYTWSAPGAGNTATVNGLAVGNYTVVVNQTGHPQCADTADATIVEPLKLTLAAQVNKITCHGSTNASIVITTTGGVKGASPAPLFYNYSWTKDGQSYGTNTNQLSGLGAGVYVVTVTDKNGCQATKTSTIVEPALLDVTLTAANITCFGLTDGKITTNITGGRAPYSYAWTGPSGFTSTAAQLTNLAAGTYTLTLKDSANYCTVEETATITAPASALSVSLNSSQNNNCAGGTQGSISMDIAGGWGGNTLEWYHYGALTSYNTASITNIKSGDYLLKVTNSGGCTASASTTLTEPALPVVTASGPLTVCSGQSITLSTTSASGETYKWFLNQGTTDVGISNSYIVNSIAQSGFYTLEVTRANGCVERSIPLQATVQAAPVVNLQTDKTHFCAGSNVVLSSQAYQGAMYNWQLNSQALSGNENNSTILVQNAGTYSLSIVTAVCTTAAETVTIQEHNPFTLTLTAVNSTCTGANPGSITSAVSGQYGTVTYDWAHLSGTNDPANISNLTEGYYCLTATDAAGCIVSAQKTIADTDISISATTTNVSCAAGNTGAINLTATYSNPAGSFGAGCYSGTPVSSEVCGVGTVMSGSNSYTSNPGDVYYVPANTTFTGSIGGGGGKIIVCGTMNASSISFWGGVTIVVNNGGKLNFPGSLAFPDNSILLNYGEVTLNGISWYGSNCVLRNYGAFTVNGNLSLSASQGQFLNYINMTITGELILSQFTVFNKGSFTVQQKTDINYGAVFRNACTLNINGPLNLNGGQLYDSSMVNVGGLTTVNANSLVYLYNSSKIETGSFTFTGGDIQAQSGACSAFKVVGASILNGPGNFSGPVGICYGQTPAPPINVNYGPDVTTNCSCSATGATVTNCSVNWAGPNVAGSTSYNLSNLVAGEYTATIVCGGCTKSKTFTINQPTALAVTNTSVTNPACHGQNTGAIIMNTTGGTTPYTFAWSTLSATTQNVNQVGAGEYILTVTDAKGCTKTSDPVIVTSPEELKVTVACTFQPSCSGASDARVISNVSGGTAPYVYTWTNLPSGVTPGSFVNGLPAGNYTLTVTDAKGCTASANVTISNPTAACPNQYSLNITLTPGDATCPEEPTGYINITVIGGAQPYQYNWNHIDGNNNASNITDLAAGSYTVTVTDANGVSSSASTTVENSSSVCPPVIKCKDFKAVPTITHVSCTGLSDGAISLAISGGYSPYTVKWFSEEVPNPTAVNYQNLSAGNYMAQISGSNDKCPPVIITALVKTPERPRIYNDRSLVCPDKPVTLTSSSPTGNLWSTGATTQSIQTDQPGAYTVSYQSGTCTVVSEKIIIKEATNCIKTNPLCDPPPPVNVALNSSCENDKIRLAIANANYLYDQYIDIERNRFKEKYRAHCMSSKRETFRMEFEEGEGHYTLYYYDQGGNLVRTVPPKGVVPIEDNTVLQKIVDEKAENKRTVFTNHTYASTYTYNSLNQLIAQNIPDHDPISVTGSTTSVQGLEPGLTVTGTQFSGNGKGFLTGSKDDKGYLYTTDDNGRTWHELSNVCTEDLLDVQQFTSTLAFVSGANGAFLVSEDAGLTWSFRPSGISADLLKVHFTPAQSNPSNIEGLVFTRAGEAYHTEYISGNQAETWTLHSDPNSLKQRLGSATLTDIEFFSETIGYATATDAQGNGHLYKTITRGYEWDEITAIINDAPITAVQAVSATSANAVNAYSHLLRTNNNQLTSAWKQQNINTNRTSFVQFISATSGVVKALPSGSSVAELLYTTLDGGKTWKLISTDGGGAPDVAFALDKVSQNGHLLYPNGNLYVTTNAGFRWDPVVVAEKLPVPVTNYPYTGYGTADNGKLRFAATGNGSNQPGLKMYHQYIGTTGAGAWNDVTFITTDFFDGSTRKGRIRDMRINALGQEGLLVFDNIYSGTTVKELFRVTVSYNTTTLRYELTPSTTLPNPVFTDIKFIDWDGNAGLVITATDLYFTTDGGANWTVSPAGLPVGVTIQSVDILANAGQPIMTVGATNGTVHFNTNITAATAWQQLSQNVIPSAIKAISGDPGASQFAAVGGSTLLLASDDNGANWKLRPFFVSLYANTRPATDLLDVSVSGTTATIVSANFGEIFDANLTSGGVNRLTPSGNIFTQPAGTKFVNIRQSGGKKWIGYSSGGVLQLSPTKLLGGTLTSKMNDFEFSGSVGIAVTDKGKILRVDNSQPETFTHITATKVQNLSDAQLVTSTFGFSVGENGTALKTTNGGTRWTTLNSGTTEELLALSFFDQNKGVAVGENGTIIRTVDGGQDDFKATVSIAGTGISDITFYDVDYMDATHLVAVGEKNNDGVIFTSTDGGANWAQELTVAGKAFYGVSFLNTSLGFAVGKDATIYRRTPDTTPGTYTWDQVQNTINNPTAGFPLFNTSLDFKTVEVKDQSNVYVAGEYGILYKSQVNVGSSGLSIGDNDTWKLLTTPSSDAGTLTNITTNNDQVFVSGTAGSVVNLIDEGEKYTDKFWYDELGRLVVSQNSKQAEIISDNYRYSYTLYDELGRIKEVGEITTPIQVATVTRPGFASQVRSNPMLEWISNAEKRQVTRTFYDMSAFFVPSLVQQNLRNRVASIAYYAESADVDTAYSHATHYSYDIHGNVKTLVQDNRAITQQIPPAGQTKSAFYANRYKRIDYQYDLISGNVNKVLYQNGRKDQFFHKYEYDADNRITLAMTSVDNINWDRDAKYFYYKHGPLKRVELGHDKVQANDYAYTLQGWIKGVNANLIDASKDIGQDALVQAGNLHKHIAQDAYGYSLRYNNNDYQAIGNTTTNNFLVGTTNIDAKLDGNPTTLGLAPGLYNGNISAMVTTIHKSTGPSTTAPETQLTAYRYDQLNRIKHLQSYRDLNTTTNQWNAITDQSASYREHFEYDKNGNITHLGRYDRGGVHFDTMRYHYQDPSTNATFKRHTNRLSYVEDDALANLHTDDIDNQNPNNYLYDKIGNLISDVSEEISNISWNVYGKVESVTRTEGSLKANLEFLYDASGNRIAKIAKPVATSTDQSTWTTTWYIRDAQGNVMATYDQRYESNELKLGVDEHHLYGSSRLGTREYEETNLLPASVTDVPAVTYVRTEPSAIVYDSENPDHVKIATNANGTCKYIGTALQQNIYEAGSTQVWQADNSGYPVKGYYFLSNQISNPYKASYIGGAPVGSVLAGNYQLIGAYGKNLFNANYVTHTDLVPGPLICYGYGIFRSCFPMLIPVHSQVLNWSFNTGDSHGYIVIPGSIEVTNIVYLAAQGARPAGWYVEGIGVGLYNMVAQSTLSHSGTVNICEVELLATQTAFIDPGDNFEGRLVTVPGSKVVVYGNFREMEPIQKNTIVTDDGTVLADNPLRTYNGGEFTIMPSGTYHGVSVDMNGVLFKNFGTTTIDYTLSAAVNTEIRNLGNGIMEARAINLGTSQPNGNATLENENRVSLGALRISNHANVEVFPGSNLFVSQLQNNGLFQADPSEYASLTFQNYERQNLLSPPTELILTAGSQTTGAIKLCIGDEANRVLNGAIGADVYFDCEPGLPMPLGIRSLVHRSSLKGKKNYELSNHLGNVLTTVSDRRGVEITAGMIDHYVAVIKSSSDYYAFGSPMEGRGTATNNYRYGFNGQEETPELGTGHATALYWEYDGRLGRRWNIDPKPNPSVSYYACFANNPIWYNDQDGDTLNFSHFLAHNKVDAYFLLRNLEQVTGLSLYFDSKGNVYTTSAGPKYENGKPTGSKTARKVLLRIMKDKDFVNVRDALGTGTGNIPNTNDIDIDNTEEDTDMSNTSPNLNKKTLAYAISFFHEFRHTLMGGNGLDPEDQKILGKLRDKLGAKGPQVRLENKIRRELGLKEYGQRKSYTSFKAKDGRYYIPYSFRSKFNLMIFKKPPTRYVRK